MRLCQKYTIFRLTFVDQPNWEEVRLAIVHARDQSTSDNVTSTEPPDSSSDEDEEADGETFDTQLPTQHQYLGEGQEIAGRTILDEDLIQDLPILARPGIILMPGQTLPMNFFHPTVISMMKNLISGSKTFGIVHSRLGFFTFFRFQYTIDQIAFGVLITVYKNPF